MSGKTCSNCYKLTFYLTITGRRCSQCAYFEEDPLRAYKGDGVPGSRFSVDSLKTIGSRPEPSKVRKVSSAQDELNRLIKNAARKRSVR